MKLVDFDRIQCVCLDHRRNTWGDLARQFSQRGARVERFIVGKGKILPAEMYQQIDPTDQPIDPRWKRDFTTNAYYCWLAHHSIIKRAKEDGIQQLLILEDDCILTDDFDVVLTKTSQQIDKLDLKWDTFSFGHNLKWGKATQITDNVLKLQEGVYCWHAIGIKNHMFDHFLDMTPEGPYDWQYSRKTQPNFKCYGVWPSIALQKAGMSYVNGRVEDYSDWMKETGNNHIC